MEVEKDSSKQPSFINNVVGIVKKNLLLNIISNNKETKKGAKKYKSKSSNEKDKTKEKSNNSKNKNNIYKQNTSKDTNKKDEKQDDIKLIILNNPNISKEIEKNNKAIYGYSAKKGGSLEKFGIDWTNLEEVEYARKERIKYHEYKNKKAGN